MESSTHPALRDDLVVSRLETPEGPRFVLKDPHTGRYYRLREAEYAVARRLDGKTPLTNLASILGAELGVEVDAGSLEAFTAQLERQGLLDDGRPRAPVRQPFVRGTTLYLRFRAFNPDRLLDWLIGRLRFLFTPYFVVGAATLILWAVWTAIAQRAVIWDDLSSLWNFQSLFVAWVTILCVVTMHEFAHGLTCKHFGGSVHEMGFMLIYFQPAFYCNISDAWLFPKKASRLWVTAAGAFFELFVWSVATVVWTVVESGTWVSGLALIVMATSAFKQFFNLNPLIKLDGYYLLSDLLDAPNLRSRAFAYLKSVFGRLTGAGEDSPSMEVSGRERAIFVTYGLAAMAFSYWFLAKIVLGMGAYLTARYQAWGFGAFTAFLGLVFPQPLRALVGRGKGASRPPTPAGDGGNGSGEHPGPKLVSVGRRRLAWLLLAGGVAVLSLVVQLPLRVGGRVRLLPARNADVRATVEGVVAQVLVEEGDEVETGDTLARLSDSEHRARLEAVAADIAEKRAQLRMLRAGPRAEEVELGRLAVAKAAERLRYAEADAQRARGLANKGFESRSALERSEEQAAVFAKELEQEQGRLRVLELGSRPESIAAMAQELVRAQAERDRLQGEMARLVLTAPHAGVVTTPRVRETVGKFVRPGDLIAEVHTIDRLTAEIEVSERDIGEVHDGQPAVLRLRAYPNRTFAGVVSRIAPVAADSGWRAERTVRVDVDLVNRDHRLKPYMTGYARVETGDRRAFDLITRRIRRFIRVEFWSWW